MQLYRGFATVGAITIASRVLGFVRDVLIAAMLGASPVADAFFVAFRIPNLLRRLFASMPIRKERAPSPAKRSLASPSCSSPLPFLARSPCRG